MSNQKKEKISLKGKQGKSMSMKSKDGKWLLVGLSGTRPRGVELIVGEINAAIINHSNVDVSFELLYEKIQSQ